MSVTLAQIVIDCANAEKLAGFWAAALGRPVDDGANPFFATVGRGTPGALMFLQVPEPKQGKNRVHLDLMPTGPGADRQAEVDRLTALGAARIAEHREYGTHWVTLTDPEGNEFDVGAGLDGD
jgi:Glyoxalase-like domain